jgi:hypothetical protein
VRDGCSQCVECREIYPGDTWEPGQFCLFGMLFACSVECGAKWALREAGEGYKPGQPGFDLEEPAATDGTGTCICGEAAYECAYCNEKRCMRCNGLSTSEEIKTAVRWCPAHHAAGRMGYLGAVPR